MNFKTTLFLLALVSFTLCYDDGHDHRSQYQQSPKNYPTSGLSPVAIGIIVCCWVVLAGLLIGSTIYVTYRCYKKNKSSSKVKEQMYLKQMQFASSMGMSVLELRNDRRFGHTDHI